MDSRQQLIRQTVRDVPDFPKPGILFKDITPVLAHRVLVRADAASRGLTAEQAIDEVLAAVPVPAGR